MSSYAPPLDEISKDILFMVKENPGISLELIVKRMEDCGETPNSVKKRLEKMLGDLVVAHKTHYGLTKYYYSEHFADSRVSKMNNILERIHELLDGLEPAGCKFQFLKRVDETLERMLWCAIEFTNDAKSLKWDEVSVNEYTGTNNFTDDQKAIKNAILAEVPMSGIRRNDIIEKISANESIPDPSHDIIGNILDEMVREGSLQHRYKGGTLYYPPDHSIRALVEKDVKDKIAKAHKVFEDIEDYKIPLDLDGIHGWNRRLDFILSKTEDSIHYARIHWQETSDVAADRIADASNYARKTLARNHMACMELNDAISDITLDLDRLNQQLLRYYDLLQDASSTATSNMLNQRICVLENTSDYLISKLYGIGNAVLLGLNSTCKDLARQHALTETDTVTKIHSILCNNILEHPSQLEGLVGKIVRKQLLSAETPHSWLAELDEKMSADRQNNLKASVMEEWQAAKDCDFALWEILQHLESGMGPSKVLERTLEWLQKMCPNMRINLD